MLTTKLKTTVIVENSDLNGLITNLVNNQKKNDTRPVNLNNDILIEDEYHFLDAFNEEFKKYDKIKSIQIQNSPMNSSLTEANKFFEYRFRPGIFISVIMDQTSDPSIGNSFFYQCEELISRLLNFEIKHDNLLKAFSFRYFRSFDNHELVIKSLSGKEEFKFGPESLYELTYNNENGLIVRSLISRKNFTIVEKKNVHNEIGIFKVQKETFNRFFLSGFYYENIHNKTNFEFDPISVFINRRHYDMKDEASIKFNIKKKGFHTELNAEISNFDKFKKLINSYEGIKSLEDCKLFTHFDIQKSFILDKFSSTPESSHFVQFFGQYDLEAPAFKVKEWGTYFIINFHNLNTTKFKFHFISRYQKINSDGITKIKEIYPNFFYLCDTEDKDIQNYNYNNWYDFGFNIENYFRKNSVLFHLKQETRNDFFEIEIPNGKSNLTYIMFITFFATFLGVFFISKSFYSIFRKQK